MTRANPMGDTLSASWLGDIVNHQPPEKKTTEPVVHYTELDNAYYAARKLYGRQDTPQRTRRGRNALQES